MKKIWSLIILLSISFIASKYTSVYKCASDLKMNTCYMEEYEEEGDNVIETTYVEACPKGKICIEKTGSGDLPLPTSQCVKVKYLLFEGEKCESKSECFSGKCNQNRCEAVKEGEKCSKDNECKLGYYCKGEEPNQVCAKYAAKGEECDDDSQCRPGLVCSKNKCTQMFSVKNGAESDRDSACESGSVFNEKCGEIQKVDSCEGKVTSKATITFKEDTEVECQCNGGGDYRYSELQYAYNIKDKKKAFIEEFNKHIEDILKDDDYLEDYFRDISIYYNNKMTFGIKKLKEKWIEIEKFDEIDAAAEDDKDCVRDYYVRQLSSSHLYISMYAVILFALVLL